MATTTTNYGLKKRESTDLVSVVPFNENFDILDTTLKDLIEEGSYRDCYSLNDLVSDHVCYLGMMCNCLKNKPWKQSMMKTNKENFYKHLKLVWSNYIAILTSQDLTEEEITDLYLRKSQVNQFRVRSNY